MSDQLLICDHAGTCGKAAGCYDGVPHFEFYNCATDTFNCDRARIQRVKCVPISNVALFEKHADEIHGDGSDPERVQLAGIVRAFVDNMLETKGGEE